MSVFRIGLQAFPLPTSQPEPAFTSTSQVIVFALGVAAVHVPVAAFGCALEEIPKTLSSVVSTLVRPHSFSTIRDTNGKTSIVFLANDSGGISMLTRGSTTEIRTHALALLDAIKRFDETLRCRREGDSLNSSQVRSESGTPTADDATSSVIVSSNSGLPDDKFAVLAVVDRASISAVSARNPELVTTVAASIQFASVAEGVVLRSETTGFLLGELWELQRLRTQLSTGLKQALLVNAVTDRSCLFRVRGNDCLIRSSEGSPQIQVQTEELLRAISSVVLNCRGWLVTHEPAIQRLHCFHKYFDGLHAGSTS